MPKLLSFAAATSTGLQVVTGAGGQPVAIVFLGSYRASDGVNVGVFSDTLGFAVSPSARAAVGIAGTSGTRTAMGHTNASCILFKEAVDTPINGEADLESFDPDGFTLDWTNAPSAAWIVSALCLFAEDIENAAVLECTAPLTATSKSFSGAGFAPDSVMLFGILRANAAPYTQTSVWQTFGFCDAALNQATVGVWATDLLSDERLTVLRTDKIYSYPHWNGAGNSIAEGSVTSLDSDGFTMNFNIAVNETSRFWALCLKGNFKVGTITEPVSTGDQPITGLGGRPSAMVALMPNLTAPGVHQSNLGFSIGMSSGPGERVVVELQDDENFQVNGYLDRDKIISLHNPTTGALLSEADVASFDSDGFTLTWPTANGNRIIPYWAVIDTTITPEVTDVQPRQFSNGDIVEITGTGFKASQGNGKVELGDNHQHNLANKVEQNIDHWEDLVIRFIANKGSLPNGQVFVFVTNDDGETNDPPPPDDPGDLDTEIIGTVISGSGRSNASTEKRLEIIYAAVAGHTAPDGAGRSAEFLMHRIGRSLGINITSGTRSFETNLILLYNNLTGETYSGNRSVNSILSAIESYL